jgi:hypothetical protein
VGYKTKLCLRPAALKRSWLIQILPQNLQQEQFSSRCHLQGLRFGLAKRPHPSRAKKRDPPSPEERGVEVLKILRFSSGEAVTK